MTAVEKLITEQLDIWSSSVVTQSTVGRGKRSKLQLYGIKKLRELILELAVRGQLVPQDPNDEPASVLLEKIAIEKARLVKEKKIKKQKSLPPIKEDEKPFLLPDGWEWARFSEIVYLITDGAHHTPTYTNEGVPFLSVKDMSSGVLSFENTRYISQGEHNELSKRCHPKKGDLLLTKVGTTGVPVLVNTNLEFSLFVSVALIKFPVDKIDGAFLVWLIKSPLVKRQSASGTKGIGNKNLVLRKINAFSLAIPPLEEQHRIVAKVNELMSLCDTLEQAQESSIHAHQTLVENLLNALTYAADQGDFDQAWTRIAAHFDTLFTTEHSIDQLKQTILQLAVMGKLVAQDPEDEPASVLLAKIAAEKAQLIKAKKIKKQKVLPPIKEEEKPFELPEGWEWASLSHLGFFSGGKTPSKSNNEYWDGNIAWVTPKDMKVREIHDSKDHVTKKAINDGLTLFEPNSLLFVTRSGILRRLFPVAISKISYTVNQDLKVLTLFDTSMGNYLYIMMKGFEQYILQNLTKTGTTVESIKFDMFSTHYFMLPPLAEQKCIVKKVDQLLSLCDQLKSQIINAKTTQQRLADVLTDQTTA